MAKAILNIKVGNNLKSTLSQAQQTMEQLQVGEIPAPYHQVGFETMPQMLSVFTPKRWDVLACLREQGAITIAELARMLKRDYKNVHTDISSLMEWLAVEKDEKGRVFTPYTKIIVDVRLPDKLAA